MRPRRVLGLSPAKRPRRIRAGASLSLLALLATLLLLPLHGTRAVHAADAERTAFAVADPAASALSAQAGETDPGAPLHDAADCPQCRALAQARAAVAAASPLARTSTVVLRAPRAEGAIPLPARPDLATAHPRAPPVSLSILAV